MDNATITALVTCLITGLLKEEKTERLAYRDDLIKRVERLEDEKDSCTDTLTELKAEFAAMKVKIGFIEKENEILKLKLQNRI